MGFLDIFKKNRLPVAPVLPQEIYEAGVLELRDIIAPSAFKVNPKEINLGEKLIRTFFVISYPRYLSESWFTPIINLDKVFNVSIFIHPVETSRVLRQFQKKVAEVQSQIHLREEKGMVRDPKLDTAYQDLENLRDALQQATEKIFDVGLYISIFADDETELNRLESEIKSMLESKLVYLKPALFQQEQGFRSVIPTADDELLVHTKLNSSPLSGIFPFVSFDLTSDKGVLYGINRHNSSLVLFDRFSLENFNSIVFAKSGSGKSIHGNEVVLAKENGVINLRPIKEIVDDSIKKHGITYRDEELEGVHSPAIEVWSFNKELKGEWSEVSVAARKIAPVVFYKFQTQSGRMITATGDHNMLVIKNGRVAATKSADVAVGEWTPLPRLIAPPENPNKNFNLLELLKDEKLYVVGADSIINKNYKNITGGAIDNRFDRYLYKYRVGRRMPLDYFFKVIKKIGLEINNDRLQKLEIVTANGSGRLPVIFPITEDFAKILGYITSEGTITETAIMISNTDKEVIADIKKAFENLAVSCFEANRGIVAASRPFLQLIKVLGVGGKSADKRVPPFLFGSERKIIAAYLASYFEGDGGVEKNLISAVSKSKNLISDLSYLLLYFDVIARVKARRKKNPMTGRKRIYWQLAISGKENVACFAKNIGFVSERKCGLNHQLAERAESNTNVDVIPTVRNLIEELNVVFPFATRGLPEINVLRTGKSNPSPRRLSRVIKLLKQKLVTFREMETGLKCLVNLPPLEKMLSEASTDKIINHRLWQTLGTSWSVMKNQRFAPLAQNAFALMSVLDNASPTVGEVKMAIATGCHKLNLPLKSIDRHLGVTINQMPQRNTSYETLRVAAERIMEYYEKLATALPKAEIIIATLEKLANADLFWDPIVRVERIKNHKEKYVYDLTVDNEVFAAGYAGMFVHNSYMTKLEILRSLMFDVDILVLDPEREYEYMANATGGKYFNISLTSEHHINPFELPVAREDESPADVLRSHIINLVGLFRIMLGGLSPEEDSITDRAITETYALKDINIDSDFAAVEPPLMSDFEMVLAGMEGGEALVQRLAKYTHGTWTGFINQPSNIDIDGKFVVFSLRDMEEELKPVAMYIVTHFIWNAIRKKLKKRLLVIDEAWWMMKSEDTASFLLSLAKRGRKYFLGLATITQDVDDFLKSSYGLPIITNSSIQILLKQSTSVIDKIQQIFNLTDEEKFLLLESDVGEGIFFAGLKHVAVKVIASYTEDQIITSDPSQILAIKKARQELEAAEGGGGEKSLPLADSGTPFTKEIG